ncbi:hypothetical protein ACTHPF_06010 [Paenibacillus sp. SAF-054]|uniref:hypothetical protein n=1 Tax=unclassified Paenibacillus TaxID=185978 RepID=UPI003F810995
MNHNILIESENLLKRIKEKYPVYEGRRANRVELQELQRRLDFNLPDWYFDLYLNHSIIDSEFGFQEDEPEEDYDGISFVIWGDIKSVIQESFEFEPGISMMQMDIYLLQVALMEVEIHCSLIFNKVQMIRAYIEFIMMIFRRFKLV